MIRYDGHVHTPFCPHGTNDSLEEYIHKAISLGMNGLTFTEHAPLPKGFKDPAPSRDSAMNESDLPLYLQTLKRLKKKYADRITVNIGLEVDYIEGYEEERKAFLDKWGKDLDDAILSVHFLQFDQRFFCLDYSPDLFRDLIAAAGSLDAVYRTYFHVVKKAVLSDLGNYKPRRIGHLTLVRKFQKKFPTDKRYEAEIFELLDLIQEGGYALDYNGAGFSKPFCGEPYPPSWVVNEAVKRKIPLIYGSDAHAVKGMGQGFERLAFNHLTTTPILLTEQR